MERLVCTCGCADAKRQRVSLAGEAVDQEEEPISEIEYCRCYLVQAEGFVRTNKQAKLNGITRKDEVVADLAQESLIGLLKATKAGAKNGDPVRDEAALLQWIVKRRVCDWIRKDIRSKLQFVNPDELDRRAYFERANTGDFREAMRRCLNSTEMAVVTLLNDEMTIEEIAAEMEFSESKVKRIRAKAREKLRRYFDV